MKIVFFRSFTLVFSFCFLLLSQCKENPKSESPEDRASEKITESTSAEMTESTSAETTDEGSVSMEDVIAVHDEVMPKMKEIGRLVAELKPMADSTEAGAPYLKAMTDLQAAYTSMMDWMKGFGDRFDYEEIQGKKPLTPEKQAWLEEEDVKVKAMRDQVNQSIAAARELLGKE